MATPEALLPLVSNPVHLLAMWGNFPGSQKLQTVLADGYGCVFFSDWEIAKKLFGDTPLPTRSLATLVRQAPMQDGLVFSDELDNFNALLNSACDGNAESTLALSKLTRSLLRRHKWLLRFHEISNPARDSYGGPLRLPKTPENLEAIRYHATCGPGTQAFGDVITMAEKRMDCEATHPNHAKQYKEVELIVRKIKNPDLAKHGQSICELMPRLAKQLEVQWFADHPVAKQTGDKKRKVSSAKVPVDFRWSFRYIMMRRCAGIHPPPTVEHWMHIAEQTLPRKLGTSALQELRVYLV